MAIAPLPRLKWHMLRRRKSDVAFLRENLVAALRAGAACEVDIALTADGHALCLHDRTLDRETTGHGPVEDALRADVERLRQRGRDGAPLDAAPLFLDEVVACVIATRASRPAITHGSSKDRPTVGESSRPMVQLDIKERARALTPAVLDRMSAVLGSHVGAFIASAYDWDAVQRLTSAVPGLHAGFDPLALYPRSLALDADGFRDLAARTLSIAPDAALYYLEARLILAALERGVNLVRAMSVAGAHVDAWTIDADHPQLDGVLRRLIEAGVHQITSNDPEALAPRIEALAVSSPISG